MQECRDAPAAGRSAFRGRAGWLLTSVAVDVHVGTAMTDTQIVLLLLPVILIELGLIVFALRDLLRPERRVRGDSKLMWGLIIVFISLLGPIVYFVVGREPE
jgi:hypothetical protein